MKYNRRAWWPDYWSVVKIHRKSWVVKNMKTRFIVSPVCNTEEEAVDWADAHANEHMPTTEGRHVGIYNTGLNLWQSQAAKDFYGKVKVIDGYVWSKGHGYIAHFDGSKAAIKTLMEAGYVVVKEIQGASEYDMEVK